MKLTVYEQPANTPLASGVEGETVTVFEGNWYFDPAAVDMSHLRVTERTYTCPYKGTCFWIDLESPTAHLENVAWVYNNPNPGYEHIKDLIGFHSRDTIWTTAERS